ncbi:MAG: glucose-1-phosphate adenylyltransferase family protein [Candidatus Sumerlaeaceae bacterium]
MRNVIALVLAGGRMGEYGVLTHNRAKGALTFAGSYRIIDFALSNLVNAGIEQIGIIIQYLPASLIEHVGVGQPWDLHGYGRALKIMPPFVGVEKTAWYKGTADALYQNLNFVRDVKPSHVVVLSGEHVYHLDYKAVLRAHCERNADVTMVTRELPKEKLSRRFGYVVSDENGRISEFYEKPASPPSNVVSAGIFVFRTEVLLAELEANARMPDHNLAKDVLQRRAGELECFEYRTHDYWEYLENVTDYYEAQFRLMAEGSHELLRRWNVLTNLEFRGVGFAPAASFGSDAHVFNVLAGANCHIEGTVSDSILSPGVRVGRGAVVRKSILFHDCHIGEGATLDGVVSDRDVIFEAGCKIGTRPSRDGDTVTDLSTGTPVLTLIGKAVQIGPGVIIPKGVQLRAGRVLPDQAAANAEI